MRRLLENGANSSFVNRFMNESVPVDTVVEDPIAALQAADSMTNPHIPLPNNLYGASRENSVRSGLGQSAAVGRADRLAAKIRRAAACRRLRPSPARSNPLLTEVRNPANLRSSVGYVSVATKEDIALAFDKAGQARKAWDDAGATHRAACLVAAADKLRVHRAELVRLLVKEAGKTLPDAIAEVREAEDFCRYYAAQAREHFAEPTVLPGPTGEDNKLSLRGRGVFACISPWNFPLAIFLGQVTAALVAGNSVVAKPAGVDTAGRRVGRATAARGRRAARRSAFRSGQRASCSAKSRSNTRRWAACASRARPRPRSSSIVRSLRATARSCR